MTLQEMTSAVINNVLDGLSGITPNKSFSEDQIMSEINQTREELIMELQRTGKIDVNEFKQTIPKVPIFCDKVSPICSEVSSYAEIPVFKIPGLIVAPFLDPITYIGVRGLMQDICVYYSIDQVINHKNRVYTSKLPFIYIALNDFDHDNMLTGLMYNMGKLSTITDITVQGLLKDPTWMLRNDPEAHLKEYPAPLSVQRTIIKRLTSEKIDIHRKLNLIHKPNNQTDIVV